MRAVLDQIDPRTAEESMPLDQALLQAKHCCREGRLAEAEALCRQVIDAQPATAEAEHILGVIAQRNGKLGEAIEHISRAIAIKPDVVYYHSNLGECYRLAGRIEESIAASRRALEIDPDYPSALNNLGIALFEQDEFEEALLRYDRAIALQDDFASAHNNRGNALQRLNRFAEAEPAYRRALALQPHFVDALANLGACLRELKRPEEAQTVYRQALQLDPDNADTLDCLALAFKDLDRLDPAVELVRRALALDPRREKLHLHFGAILLEQRKFDEAAAAAERALAINPGNADAVNLMGRIAFVRGDLQAAIAQSRRALALKPDLAEAHHNIGNALKELGQLTQALDAYSDAVRLNPSVTGFYVNMAECKTFTPDDPHLATMEALAAKGEALLKAERLQLDFALGKAYADLKEYDRSFRHLLAGNAAKRSTISYDETAVFALFERIEALFTPELIAAKAGGGDPSPLPIFVFGMPRSGTTLVEQIIASHPSVHGAGELSAFGDVLLTIRGLDGNTYPYPEFMPKLDATGLQYIGAHYIAALRKLAPDKDRITDKMPANYNFAGLIHLALPNAKMIHTIRDPLDTCISCFSKLFSGEQLYTYDLGELGRYYKRYERLMAHWRKVLPADRVLEVRYEDVVGDLEAEARQIIAYCDLPWDDRCLKFHETKRPVHTASAAQVRQSIYKGAIGRWRVYEQHLGPLLQALERPNPAS
jgi:tetratricopeptide (TPR) repeat protein